MLVVNLPFLFSAPRRRGGPDGERRSRRQQPVPERRPLGGRPQDAGAVPGRHLAAGRADVGHLSLSLSFLLDMISWRSPAWRDSREAFRTR